jgi:hypothetical protein
MGLRADVDASLSVMPPAEHRTMETDRRVRIWSEEVAILGRIYHPEPSQGLSDLTRLQKTILSSLYTRHHDGFVRERHVCAGEVLPAMRQTGTTEVTTSSQRRVANRLVPPITRSIISSPRA